MSMRNGSTDCLNQGKSYYKLLMPQSHPTTDPVRFLPPARFPSVRLSEASIRILRQCCSRSHIRLQAPNGLTLLHISTFFNKLKNSTGILRGARTCMLRTHTGFFSVFHTVGVPHVAHAGSAGPIPSNISAAHMCSSSFVYLDGIWRIFVFHLMVILISLNVNH